MSIKLDGPIPGQSLTREMGNAPWEQPPQFAHPQQALAWHLDRMNKGQNMDDLLFLVEQGFPIQTFVESLTTKAVMEGYHNGDTAVLISPVLHEYVKEMAETAGIQAREFSGPTEEDRQKSKYKERLQIRMGKALAKEGGGDPAARAGIGASLPFSPEAPPPEAMAQGGPVVPDMNAPPPKGANPLPKSEPQSGPPITGGGLIPPRR